MATLPGWSLKAPMKFLILSAPALALALLGAHFSRESAWLPALACAMLAALTVLRRTWVPRLLQAALLLGSLEWLWTTAMLVQQRMALGRPWSRMAMILGVVTLLTALSALALRSERARAHFERR